MMVNSITPEQAAAIPPLNLSEYAVANGWIPQKSRRPERVILSRKSGPDQLIFPKDETFDDYGRTILELIEKLAAIENRPTFEIYSDLLAPDSDNARAGVISPEANRGQLDFDFAVSLLNGFRQAIIAAAHSVISPRSMHPRLNRSDAVELVKAAKLNHSERSSFTVSVSLPLHPVPSQLTLANSDPFTRRVTKLLMQSVYRIHTAIENGDVVSAAANEPNQPLISANLCDALLKMQPTEEKAELRLGVGWATVRPAPEMSGVPRSIRFRRGHFKEIAELYARLCPLDDPKPRAYIGFVERLVGVIGPIGRREGDVDIDLFVDGESVRARANLDADQHEVADRAYMAGAMVDIVGVLERRRGLSRLEGVTKFELIQEVAPPPLRQSPTIERST